MRSLLLSPLVLLLASSATPAQSSAVDGLVAAPGPVHHAGTYEVRTGRWLNQPLPDRLLGDSSGPDLIYDSSIPQGFFLTPGAAATVLDDASTVSRGLTGVDQVNCFTIGYGTTELDGTVDLSVDIYSSYALCAGIPGPPAASISLVGLPGSPDGVAVASVLITLDLQCSGLEFLVAQGNGVTQFGYAITPADGTRTGPLLATGGFGHSGDAFERVGGANPGCFFFGGFPLAEFYLQVYSNPLDVVAFYGSGINTLCLEAVDAPVVGQPVSWRVSNVPSPSDVVRLYASLNLWGIAIGSQELLVGPGSYNGFGWPLTIPHAGGSGTLTFDVPPGFNGNKVFYLQAVATNSALPGKGVSAASNGLQYTL